jgi:site-specific DNA-methyltransferase (adenine-specific)
MNPIRVPQGTFYNQDCVAGAREHLPDNTVDLIITDPPYGIRGDQLHQHYNRNEGCVVDGYVEIPEGEYAAFTDRWVREAERVLRPGGSLYIVSGYTNLYHILHALRGAGLSEVNHIVWRYSFGVYTSRKYVSSHYHVLYYAKPGGERTFNLESRYGGDEREPDGSSLNYQDREDVWMIPREYKPGKRKNKNELPLALLVKMLQYSSNEGDLICDFFLGGFSTAKAALGLNRRIVGFEVSEAIFTLRAPEMRQILAGHLLPQLRVPLCSERRNRRRAWQPDDLRQLASRFDELCASGKAKKEIVSILQQELGRGRWSIENALKKSVANGNGE